MTNPEYYAHSLKGEPPEKWQRLEDHLRQTAELAAEFARPFGAEKCAYLVGLWHDIGKYSREYQKFLATANEPDYDDQIGRIDHSSAGAQHAVSAIPCMGHLLAYSIAGHHSGLHDGHSIGTCQKDRLLKKVFPYAHGINEFPEQAEPELPLFIRESLGRKDAFSLAFFTRMIFSCLVDADYLDTELFVDQSKATLRGAFPSLNELAPRFYESLKQFERSAADSHVNRERKKVRISCENAAADPPGFFSLTVPTGGGKTLSSLDFALRHATKYGLRRIVYVVPFTSIIEQNVDVFRRHLGFGSVLEHHSNVDTDKETSTARLATENWDAPIVVTTAVQFYESLFGNRSSHCRKLHRLARSVIILDEAQTLPVDYLAPCLRALRELKENYGTTLVLCTATQPEVSKRPEFEIGLEGVREIVPDSEALYLSLKRVDVEDLGRLPDDEMKRLLEREKQALCIVNTTKHAKRLFELLGPARGHFHLSARMCPAHRRLRLWQIRRALEANEVCRVVSTQVVEAGIDLDFPRVFRALAGLDSIAQAAGRCNRNGLFSRGRIFVFQTEHEGSNRYFADTAQCAAQVMELHKEDPLSLKAIERFFRLYYWDQKSRWDANSILERFRLVQDRSFPFDFNFKTTERLFNLIDDGAQFAVIVPWDRKARKLGDRLRAMPLLNRDALRESQRYIVQAHKWEWDSHAGRDIKLLSDRLGVLEDPEVCYDSQTGLHLEAAGPGYLMA